MVLKKIVRFMVCQTPLYHSMRKRVLAVDGGMNLLEDKLRRDVDHVPFYAAYRDALVQGAPLASLSKFPIMRKQDIIDNASLLCSRRIHKGFVRRIETGGSTGVSLSLYRSVSDSIKEIAVIDTLFSLIGSGLKIGVLRGNKPKSGLFEVVSRREVLLSSYSLNMENIDKYLQILQSYDISCLHVYPSSIMIFARLVHRKYGQVVLPKLKGIFASSEIFAAEDKVFVKSVFPNVKLIDYYGHNEQACAAYSIDGGEYHFLPAYGYVEFIDTGETRGEFRIAEIVATSILNETMPLVRYGTEDYVELDNENRIVAIIGRSSDFVLNEQGDIVPCIISTRPLTLKNVVNFQYYQEKQGELHFRVVVSDAFSDADIEMIREDLVQSFDGKMTCFVDVVSQIERTKRGKQMRLIQKLKF